MLQEFLTRNFICFAVIFCMLLKKDDVFGEFGFRYHAILNIYLILIVADGIELCTASLGTITILGKILYASIYSLRPVLILIILSFIILKKNNRFTLYVLLCVLNSILVFAVIIPGMQHIDTFNNSFARRFLDLFPNIVVATLLIALILESIYHSKEKIQNSLTCNCYVTAIVISALILQTYYQSSNIGSTGLLVGTLIYFINYHMQKCKIDSLALCYNNLSFHSDIPKYKDKIEAIILIDMNNLKKLNDTLGHQEGNKAIKTMARTILEVLPSNFRLYRIGGDEFAVLCINTCEKDIKTCVSDINDEMKKTPYTWSMGIAYKGFDFDTMMKIADQKMYETKKLMKSQA